MRLRRLEMAVLALTLAFAFFMGGFFTGRSTGTVSIMAAQSEDGTIGTQISISQHTPVPQEPVSQTPAQQAQEGREQESQEIHETHQSQSPQPQEPTEQEPAQGTGAPRDSDGKININTAGIGELTDLPGIGQVIASRIIDYRTQNGGFSKIEDIQNVSGIGEKRFEAIRDLITVG